MLSITLAVERDHEHDRLVKLGACVMAKSYCAACLHHVSPGVSGGQEPATRDTGQLGHQKSHTITEWWADTFLNFFC